MKGVFILVWPYITMDLSGLVAGENVKRWKLEPRKISESK
jgi:hypothetical protein